MNLTRPSPIDPFYGTGREILASGHVTDAAQLNLSNVSDPLTPQGTVAPTSRMLGGTPSSCAVEGVPVERADDNHDAMRLGRCAPSVEFISKESAPKLYHGPDPDGRRYRLSPAEVAYASTGMDRMTRKPTLGIGIRNRCNGTTVRFECDLWKLDYDLSPGALRLLADRWQHENAAMPRRKLNRMARHFSRMFLQFDAMRGQASAWKGFLSAVLSDASSFTQCGLLPNRSNRSWKLGDDIEA